MSKEIKERMKAIREKTAKNKREVSSLNEENFSLGEEYCFLERKLAIADVPVVSVDFYYDESDEYRVTGEMEIEDPLDERLNVNTSNEGKHARLTAGIEGLSGIAIYSMNENPLGKVFSGKVKFTYPKHGEDVMYESEVVDSPNNAQALMYFYRAMHYVEDLHHSFLEGYEIKEENGISTVKFIAGS